jgi:hypothetical protein
VGAEEGEHVAQVALGSEEVVRRRPHRQQRHRLALQRLHGQEVQQVLQRPGQRPAVHGRGQQDGVGARDAGEDRPGVAAGLGRRAAVGEGQADLGEVEQAGRLVRAVERIRDGAPQAPGRGDAAHDGEQPGGPGRSGVHE